MLLEEKSRNGQLLSESERERLGERRGPERGRGESEKKEGERMEAKEKGGREARPDSFNSAKQPYSAMMLANQKCLARVFIYKATQLSLQVVYLAQSSKQKAQEPGLSTDCLKCHSTSILPQTAVLFPRS